MKNLFILVLGFIMSLTVSGQISYLKFPTYDEVIERFFSQYSVKNFSRNAQIRFEKQPIGWLVNVIEFSDEPKSIQEGLLWDRKDNKFKEINFEKLAEKDENWELLNQYKSDWTKKYFSICPYYGYPGWDSDVIEEFKNANNLPDSTLYALGRAYSSYASNLLNNNSGFADKRNQFILPDGKNCMTVEQLDKYRYYSHLAIKKYKEVTELNPKYETIVGAIGIKASNEYLTSFLNLRIYQNESEAQKELVEGLYNDFYLAAARNYLNSCAPNAILFTNGDNDTYPLLYVQAKYGFRTDVLVVNISLLQTDRYINSLREKILDAPGLPISITHEKISGNKREYFLIEKKDDNPMELKNLVDYALNDDNKKSYDGVDYYYVPSNKFKLTKDENVMEWEVSKSYIFRYELVIMDILATNKLERPIYFAVTLSPDAYFNLDDYMKLEGMAYRLSLTKKDMTNDQFGAVNSSVLYENLMTKFDWNGLNKAASHEKLICLNYRSNFNRLAESLIKENKQDAAKRVLEKCVEIMPNEIVYYDIFMIPVIECYYKLNEFEKANSMVKVLMYNFNNNVSNYRDITLAEHADHRAKAINRLKELAIEYNQQEILKIIEK